MRERFAAAAEKDVNFAPKLGLPALNAGRRSRKPSEIVETAAAF